MKGVMRLSKRGTMVERLATRLGHSARAEAIFADAVESDGVTVVPVAKARWGFGAGGGSGRGLPLRRRAAGKGGGGGGGIVVSPVGFIEIHDGHGRFRAIRDPMLTVPLLLGGGLILAWTVGRLARSLRGAAG
ncbi:MAG TPA: spore germination protein GerW family protein [Longimicrobiales bacterium]|nr:spore germination protein GerW family protein [Longimicrobiales bacterium]